jgi:hypothetical protein
MTQAMQIGGACILWQTGGVGAWGADEADRMTSKSQPTLSLHCLRDLVAHQTISSPPDKSQLTLHVT